LYLNKKFQCFFLIDFSRKLKYCLFWLINYQVFVLNNTTLFGWPSKCYCFSALMSLRWWHKPWTIATNWIYKISLQNVTVWGCVETIQVQSSLHLISSIKLVDKKIIKCATKHKNNNVLNNFRFLYNYLFFSK
jgi:hypothetical protein